MWDHESSSHGSRAAGQRGPLGGRPERDDTHEESHAQPDVALRFPGVAPLGDADEIGEAEDDGPDEGETPPYGDLRDEMWLRLRARRMIREFLRSVPRSEPEATLSFLAPDGEMRLVSRGDLTRAIDQLRPRMRQIIRLNIEEGWPRGKVCVYLHDISMKTLERDQMEGLDLLSEI